MSDTVDAIRPQRREPGSVQHYIDERAPAVGQVQRSKADEILETLAAYCRRVSSQER